MYAGFDLGGSQLKYGLLDSQRHVVKDGLSPTPMEKKGLLDLVADCLARMKGWTDSPILAAGFGLPGLYDHREKAMIRSPHLAYLDRYRITADLEGLLGCPLAVDNEANLAAFGEFKEGAGRGLDSLALVTVGTGIGAGLVLDGEIWQGAGFAGELGHIPIGTEGFPCTCGSRGCLETEVSAPAIVRIYRDLSGHRQPTSFSDVVQAATGGDGHARESFVRAGRSLGRGIAVLINLIHPEKILLGGGVLEAGDFLMAPAREEAEKLSIPSSFQRTTIEKSGLGNRAGFIGAALMAADLIGSGQGAES